MYVWAWKIERCIVLIIIIVHPAISHIYLKLDQSPTSLITILLPEYSLEIKHYCRKEF